MDYSGNIHCRENYNEAIKIPFIQNYVPQCTPDEYDDVCSLRWWKIACSIETSILETSILGIYQIAK